ncbi:MAG: MlaE family ABC transporter permease, partial [Myxococcaceae bacterium]
WELAPHVHCAGGTMAMLERLGRALESFLEQTGELGRYLAQTVRLGFRRPWDGHEYTRQLYRLGVQSMPVVIVTGLFTGMVMALQTYKGFERFGATIFVGTIVALSVMRELSPVLTALMVTGRCGSAMAAEIGTMRVSEQIDALVAMSTEPVQYLFVPRVLAGVTMMPILTIIADAIAILGGRAVSIGLLGANSDDYDQSTFVNLNPNDLLGGVVKAFVFGLAFTLIACARGFSAKGGAEGVGRSTTQAVVQGSLAIIVSDFLLTRLMF